MPSGSPLRYQGLTALHCLLAGIGDGVSLMKLMMQQVMDVSLNVQEQMPKKFASKGIAMRIVKVGGLDQRILRLTVLYIVIYVYVY